MSSSKQKEHIIFYPPTLSQTPTSNCENKMVLICATAKNAHKEHCCNIDTAVSHHQFGNIQTDVNEVIRFAFSSLAYHYILIMLIIIDFTALPR